MCDYRCYEEAFEIFAESVDDQHFIGAANFLYNNHYNYFQESMDEWHSFGNSREREDGHKHFTSKLMEIVI